MQLPKRFLSSVTDGYRSLKLITYGSQEVYCHQIHFISFCTNTDKIIIRRFHTVCLVFLKLYRCPSITHLGCTMYDDITTPDSVAR